MNIILLIYTISYIAITFISMQIVINLFNRRKVVQFIGKYVPKEHIKKQDTPTSGGIVIVSTIVLGIYISYILNIIEFNIYDVIITMTIILFCLIGTLDDILKILYRNNIKGLSPKSKFYMQVIVSVLILLILCQVRVYYNVNDRYDNIFNINIFYIKYILGFFTIDNTVNLGYLLYFKIDILGNILHIPVLYILFGMFVLVGTVNAVNLTDGLDGLAGGLSLISIMGFVLIISISSLELYKEYQNLYFILTLTSISIMIFLYFNRYPAKIFMGDSGSLAIGSFLGILSIILKLELIFMIMAGVFVWETISVIIQVIYFKRYKKRFFLIAPYHHHLEKKGFKETEVVLLLYILGLSLLFLSIILFIYSS